MTTEQVRWLLVADDITGAAEVAGAAVAMGYRVRIVRDGADPRAVSKAEIVVLDTDSRSLPPESAAARVQRLLRLWLATGRSLVYKKTDSVLRGNVAVELRSCLGESGHASTVLISANPTRGRTVQSGVLYVGGVALHETDFARDPEHPATASDLQHLIGADPQEHEHLKSPTGKSSARFITADAMTADDLTRWAEAVNPEQLPAGGVEFFQAILKHASSSRKSHRAVERPILHPPLLTVCGSRSIAGRLARDELLRCGGVLLRAPHDLVAARLASRRCTRWAKNAAQALISEKMVVLETGRVNADPARVRDAVAVSVGQVLKSTEVKSLLVEGGATASAILANMGWNSFEVIGEIEAGTVALRLDANSPTLVLKPGTYRWPPDLLDAIEQAMRSEKAPISQTTRPAPRPVIQA